VKPVRSPNDNVARAARDTVPAIAFFLTLDLLIQKLKFTSKCIRFQSLPLYD